MITAHQKREHQNNEYQKTLNEYIEWTMKPNAETELFHKILKEIELQILSVEFITQTSRDLKFDTPKNVIKFLRCYLMSLGYKCSIEVSGDPEYGPLQWFVSISWREHA